MEASDRVFGGGRDCLDYIYCCGQKGTACAGLHSGPDAVFEHDPPVDGDAGNRGGMPYAWELSDGAADCRGP